jgi:hypothetical protein
MPAVWFNRNDLENYILVRIRIRGSVPLCSGSGLNLALGPDPVLFVSNFHDHNKKGFSKFFCLFLFQGKFTFLTFFDNGMIRILVKIRTNNAGSGYTTLPPWNSDFSSTCLCK